MDGFLENWYVRCTFTVPRIFFLLPIRHNQDELLNFLNLNLNLRFSFLYSPSDQMSCLYIQDAFVCKTCPDKTASICTFIITLVALYALGIVLGNQAMSEEERELSCNEDKCKMKDKLAHARGLNVMAASFKQLMVAAAVA